MRISCVFNKRRSFALLSSLVSDYRHNRQNCERWKILCNCVIDQWGEKRRIWSADLLLIFLNLGISVKIGQRHSSLECTLSDLVSVKQSVIQFFVMMPQSPPVSTLYTLLVLTAGKADVYTIAHMSLFLRHSQAGTDDVWYDPYVSWDSLKCQQYKTTYKRIVSSDELANCGKTADQPNIWGLKTFVFSKTFVLPKAFGV